MQETQEMLGLGRSPGEGNGNSLQYSFMENHMNRAAWQTIVHGVTESEKTEHTHTHTQTQGVNFLETGS